MDILTLDFETYYDKVYSLSKMTTEEYIRSPLFETIGVSVKVNDRPGTFFSGTDAQTHDFLAKYNWDSAVGVAHHAAFDMAILNWRYDIRPKFIADTLSMARLVDGPDAGNSLAALATRYNLKAKGNEVQNNIGMRRKDFSPQRLAAYGEYCCDDGGICYDLFNIFAPIVGKSEAQLIDLTIRMFTEPALELDGELLRKHLDDVKSKKQKLLDAVSADKDALMSNPKLAELLEQFGVRPPRKLSPTTGQPTWAFAKSDPGFQALLEHANPHVQALIAARLGVKSTLEETRTERMIGIAQRGSMPVPLRYYAAHTGRWGGDDKLNLQNLPRKSVLKDAILAPAGHKLIDCDSSQIEARVLAWLARQDDLVEMFEKNNEEIAAGVPKQEMQHDPYRNTASNIYHKATEDITDIERHVGKWTLLGCGYAMGAPKFQAQLRNVGIDLPIEACQRIIYIYRERYWAIPELWEEANQVLTALINGQTAPLGREGVLHVNLLGIHLPNGAYLRYRNLRTQPDPMSPSRTEKVYDMMRGRTAVPTRIYGGKVVENVTQALARIVVGEQMLQIRRKHRVVMTVHDSVGSLVRDALVPQAQAYIEGCMRTRPSWAPDLPLNCTSTVGQTYGG